MHIAVNKERWVFQHVGIAVIGCHYYLLPGDKYQSDSRVGKSGVINPGEIYRD
jgi:hypothetical protein